MHDAIMICTQRGISEKVATEAAFTAWGRFSMLDQDAWIKHVGAKMASSEICVVEPVLAPSTPTPSEATPEKKSWSRRKGAKATAQKTGEVDPAAAKADADVLFANLGIPV